MTDNDASALRDLLDRWEDQREAGVDVPIEELCDQHPHLAEVVKLKIKILRAFESLSPDSTDGLQTNIDSQREGPFPLPQIPGYEILQELGRGGMGVVYLGVQQSLRRQVALKMILAGPLAGRQHIARFRVEAEAVARLRHPGVVQIIEINEHGGQPYLTLEYLGGGSLSEKLRNGPLPARDAAVLVQSLAEGLQAMHVQGILHRDLKPANILFSTEGLAKISDFGLAKFRDRTGADVGYETATEAVLGTPAYMAPEQAAGKAKELEPAADIYALGGILYHCLTGRPPFQGNSVADILSQLNSRDPVSPRALLPAVPSDLETICLKCLRKEPGRRYTSARELADDLGRFLRHEPILARPIGRIEKSWRWCRRNPVLAATTGLTVTLILLAAILGILFGVTQARHRRDAELRLARGSHERAVVLWRQGEESQALLWLVRALEQMPVDATDLQDDLRRQIDATEKRTPKLSAFFAHDGFLTRGTLNSPDGKNVLICRPDSVQLYDLILGEKRGPPIPWDAEKEPLAWTPKGTEIVLGRGGDILVLDAVTGVEVRRIRCPSKAAIVALTAAPGSETIATVDSTGQVHLRGPKHEYRMLGPTGGADSVAFSPDGTVLAMRKPGTSVSLWNVGTGKRILEVSGRFTDVVAFSPDSKRLAVGGGPSFQPGEATLWDTATGKALATVPHRFPVTCIAFGRDSSFVVTGGEDGEARIWHATTGRLLTTPLIHATQVRAVAISADDRTIAVGCGNGDVQLWDRITGRRAASTLGHAGEIYSLHFIGNQSLVAMVPRQVRRWDLPRPITWLHDSPIDRFWVVDSEMWTFTRGGAIHRHDTKGDGSSNGRIGALSTLTTRPVALSPDGGWVALAEKNGAVRLRDARGTLLVTLLSDSPNARPVGFVDGGTALVISNGPEFQIRDVPSGKPRGPSHSLKGVPTYRISPDGTRLAAVTTAGGVYLWNTRAGAAEVEEHDSAIRYQYVVWSPDSSEIATVGLAVGAVKGQPAGESQRIVKRWRASNGHNIGEPLVFTGAVQALAFSADGGTLAIGVDQKVLIVDANTGQTQAELVDLPARVNQLAWSPKGRSLAIGLLTTTTNQVCSIWDTTAGQLDGPWLLHPGGILGLEFTPDGKALLTACTDGGLRRWEMAESATQPIESLKGHAERTTGASLDDMGRVRLLALPAWTNRRDR